MWGFRNLSCLFSWILPAWFLVLGAFQSSLARADDPLLHIGREVNRVALSLAIGGGDYTPTELDELRSAFRDGAPVPASLQNRWSKLANAAQVLILMKEHPRFFGVGFEVESAHATLIAHRDLGQFSSAISSMIRGPFGQSEKAPSEIADHIDRRGRHWKMVPEHVHDHSKEKNGIETISPTFLSADEIRFFSIFLSRLSHSPYGEEGDFTGLHMTLDVLPIGSTEVDLRPLATRNFLLLLQQFEPAIQRIFDVRRYGGFKNFFIRPIAFDHPEFLAELAAMPVSQVTEGSLRELFFEKYIEKEFLSQVASSQLLTAKEKGEALQWPEEKRRHFRPVWKYRDVKVRFSETAPLLVEVRLPDYRRSNPYEYLRGLYVIQLLADRAYLLAKEGRGWNLDIPVRAPNEPVEVFWGKWSLDARSGVDALLAALPVPSDQTISDIVKGQPTEGRGVRYRAGEVESFGFEMEGVTPKIALFI